MLHEDHISIFTSWTGKQVTKKKLHLHKIVNIPCKCLTDFANTCTKPKTINIELANHWPGIWPHCISAVIQMRKLQFKKGTFVSATNLFWDSSTFLLKWDSHGKNGMNGNILLNFLFSLAVTLDIESLSFLLVRRYTWNQRLT